MTTINPSAWPGAVRQLRKVKGWTQAQLAEKLGVGTTTVGSWERGRHEPDAVTAAKFDKLANGQRVRARKATVPASSAPDKASASKAKAKRKGPRPASNGHKVITTVPAAGPSFDSNGSHDAIMADATLTDGQRSCLAAMRLAFVDINLRLVAR